MTNFTLPVLQDHPEPTASLLNTFPTGKKNVSFSEVKLWHECSYRHKLKYVDKIDDSDSGSVHTAFGTVIHDACEQFLKTKAMDIPAAIEKLRIVWIEEKYEKTDDVKSWIKSAETILGEIPNWMDETFPGWESVSSEELLMETIEKHPDLLMKGFVDVVIRLPKISKAKTVDANDPVKWQYWILDWKTCSYFWRKEKIADHNIYNQIVLYKHFWCLKHGIDPKGIRAAFVLLRRTVPKKSSGSCKLLPIASGPVTMEKAVKWLNNMISTIKRRFYVKNRFSCTYCHYKDTPHCT